MKILVITPVEHIQNLWDRLNNLGEIVYIPDPQSINELKERCADPDVIFTNPNKLKIYLGKDFLELFPSVICICTASTGRTHIDLDYAKKSGVSVICIKSELETLKKVTSTADLALTLSLLANRKILTAVRDVELGNWDYEKFIGRQFDELTVGVIGLGRLGSIYARYFYALGSNVVYFDPYVNDEKYERLNTLNDVFSRCDIISLHIHASKNNNQLINDNILRLRRDNLILVNTSRGEIVDEDDILKNLNSDRNFIYATDVITDENKLVKDNKLLKANEKLNNLIITPHIGGMSHGAQKLAYHKAVDLLESYVEEL